MTNERTDSSEAQPRRPTNSDPDTWRAYWNALDQPWRTEPEIDEERKEELARRCAITSDPDRGEYPFRDMELRRRDVEWLLAKHLTELGPQFVSSDPRSLHVWQRFEKDGERCPGLNLQGANLTGTDLSYLPLDGAQLDGALLTEASLVGAFLQDAHLQGANLQKADLQVAMLSGAKLKSADLSFAHWT